MRNRWVVVPDVVAVLVFVLLGRSSHDEGPFSPAGVLGTGWPFLVALVVGWVVVRLWRRPPLLPAGVVVWAVCWAGGQLLRVGLTEHRFVVSFVVVSGIALAVLLIGWRLVATALLRRRDRAGAGSR